MVLQYNIDKKKRLFILKKYFAELWIKYYIKEIVSFDLLLKFNNLNLIKLQKLIDSQEIKLKINFKQKINKEILDSLFVFEQLTNKKNSLKNNNNELYFQNTIHKYNFYKILNFLICYIFPLSTKLKLKNFNILTGIFTIKNFGSLIQTEYDFFENVGLYIFFNFKLSWLNLIDKKYCQYFLSSLKLI